MARQMVQRLGRRRDVMDAHDMGAVMDRGQGRRQEVHSPRISNRHRSRTARLDRPGDRPEPELAPGPFMRSPLARMKGPDTARTRDRPRRAPPRTAAHERAEVSPSARLRNGLQSVPEGSPDSANPGERSCAHRPHADCRGGSDGAELAAAELQRPSARSPHRRVHRYPGAKLHPRARASETSVRRRSLHSSPGTSR